MWSFFTHAGAGMAIAGLTATYYALSRVNYQGERERMTHEKGFGDGPQVNRLRKHNENAHLTPSNMLLKKELEELSTLQGSGSGLNIIYQQKNPLHRLYRSNFEITPIISRVDTRPSSTSLPSEEEEVGSGYAAITSGASVESVFGCESNADNDKNDVMMSSDSNALGSKNEEVIASDEFSNLPAENNNEIKAKSVMTVITDEKAGGDVTAAEDKNEMYAKDVNANNSQDEAMDANENEWEDMPISESSIVAQSESDGSEQRKPVQENQVLKRTQSPICFFKNPGFGNRFAVNVKKKAEPSPLVARLSASKLNAEAEAAAAAEVVEQQGHTKTQAPREESVQLSPSADVCQKNSTQFILSPDLSKSNVSTCEAENPEKLLKRRKKIKPDGSLAADAISIDTKSTIVDTNPIKEISEYNKTIEKKVNNNGSGDETGTEPRIRRRADPDNVNFHPPLKRVVRPVMQIRPSEPDNKGQQCKTVYDTSNDEANNSDKNGQTAEETDKKEIDHEKDDSKETEKDCKQENNNLPEKEKEEMFENVLEEPLPSPPVIVDVQHPPPNNFIFKVGSVRTRTASWINDIPNDSWIAIPFRVYNNSMRTLPWPLIGFCILVVIIAGLLGMFLTNLADIISHRHYQDGKL